LVIKYLDAKRIRGSSTGVGANVTHSQTSSDTQEALGHTNHLKAAQRIQAGHTLIGKTVTSCVFNLRNANNFQSGTVVCELLESDGTLKAAIGTVNVSTITTSHTAITFTGGAGGEVAADDMLALRTTGLSDSNYLALKHHTSSQEANSHFVDYVSGSWSNQTSKDLYFTATYASTVDEKTTLVTTYADSLGSAVDATNNGATADSATAINGKASLTFDDSNDWISLGTGLNSSIDGNAFSISLWAYVSATNINDKTIIGKQIAGYSSPYHVFNVRAISGSWSLTTNDGTDYQSSTSTAISHTGWTHIVATFDGTSSFKVYADNVEVCSYSNSNTNWSNSYWSLGNGEGTTRWWDSEIQDVAIWSRVLTSGERATLLNSYAHGTATSSGNTGKVATDISTTGLLAYYTLNDTTTGVTNSATDYSDLPENTLFEETDTYRTWWLQDNTWKGYITRGVFGGSGQSGNKDVMDYITIATLGNAIDFGNLTTGRDGTGVASTTRGCFGGGNDGSNSLNIIDYITVASIGNATDFGDLSQARKKPGGFDNDSRGCFGGGHTGSAYSNVIDYITISTTGNATDFGDMTVSGDARGGLDNNSRGVFGGGGIAASTDTMDYVTIATTGNATDFGDLTGVRSGVGAVSNTTRGCFCGGYRSVQDDYVNVMDYITIATTGNATDFGDLSTNLNNTAGVADPTRGCIGGGYDSGESNVIQYITIDSTGNATDFGDLTAARSILGGLAA
jgi:hypothetical protein